MIYLPQWTLLLLSKWPDFTTTLFGALAGSTLGFLFSLLLAGKQNKKIIEDKIQQNKKDMEYKKQIYLTSFLYEIRHNENILRIISSFIMDGPDIDHLWSPAEINANFIENKAWNDLITAGVLLSLNKDDITNLNITNRSIVDTKRKINEVVVNWLRIKEWAEYDEKVGNQKLTQRKLYKGTSINELKENIDYALEKIAESKKSLNELINT